MKSWAVTDIRWANEGDLQLSFWKKWNNSNPLPSGFWQRIWEYPYISSRIPSSASVLDIGGTYPFVLFKNFPIAISVNNRDLDKFPHSLHFKKWPKKKLIVCDETDISVENNSFDYVFSISTIEKMPDIFKVLGEMIRIAKYRVAVTVAVSDKVGIPVAKLREIEKFLGCRIPNLPRDALTSTSGILSKYNQVKKKEFNHIRVLAFTVDSCDKPKSVAILIPHWNSWPFLQLCLKYIKRYKNNHLEEKVYILDDSSTDGSYEKAVKTFGKEKNIQIFRFERPNKKEEADVGLLLDYGLKFVKEQYVAMIDADLFPLSKDWLSFPIWLLEKYNCSSVGLDTGLSNAYSKKLKSQTWWQPNEGYTPSGGIYDNTWFTCTNNLYRIMNTALAKVISENIGFTKATPLYRNTFRWVKSLERFKLVNKLFNRVYRKISNYYYSKKRFPYLPGGEDNGVAANHFIDINRMGPKFNIPLTSYIGLTPKDGAFGQNISGLAFHFALSTRVFSIETRKVKNSSSSYGYWVSKIIHMELLNEKLAKQMIAKSSRFQPGKYDGSIPVSWYIKEYNYIQDLLKKYKQSGF